MAGIILGSPRPQLKRQQSSYGPGQVHNMALMVKPTRIDYSINKGGLRSWLVTVIFVLICSAIITIFSDDKENEASGGEVESVEETEENSPDETISERELESEVQEKFEPQKEVREEENDELPNTQEEILLSRLRQRAINYEKQKRSKVITEETKPRVKRKRRVLEKYDADVVTETEELQSKDDNVQPSESSEVIFKREERTEEGDKTADEPEEPEQWSDRSRKRKPKPNKQQVQKKSTNNANQEPRNTLLKRKKKVKPNGIGIEFEGDENRGGAVSLKETEIETRELISIKKRPGSYNRKAITNREDYKYRHILDSADLFVERHEFKLAFGKYNSVLKSNKNSPRAHFGLGRTYQLMSEFDEHKKDQSMEDLLDHAIGEYNSVIENYETPEELFRIAAENFVHCAKLRGTNSHKIITVQRSLIDKFPDNLAYQLDFGVHFIWMGRFEDALNVFKNVLEVDPSNPTAQTYYGYVLMVDTGELEKGIHFMRKGLRSPTEDIAKNAKFYYYLGNGLTKLGRTQEAHKVYEEAVKLGLFPSLYQRSLHNLDGLKAQPWWPLESMECPRLLRNFERHWTVIKEEARRLWHKKSVIFENEEKYCEAGSNMLFYIRKENKFEDRNCNQLPSTCDFLKKLVFNSSCVKDEIKISVIPAGSVIGPHCGTINYVLEAELGLIVPSEARIRVGQETRGWKRGKFLIRDTSFETEITFDGATSNSLRMVLGIEIWHPQVPHSVRNVIGENGKV